MILMKTNVQKIGDATHLEQFLSMNNPSPLSRRQSELSAKKRVRTKSLRKQNDAVVTLHHITSRVNLQQI